MRRRRPRRLGAGAGRGSEARNAVSGGPHSALPQFLSVFYALKLVLLIQYFNYYRPTNSLPARCLFKIIIFKYLFLVGCSEAEDGVGVPRINSALFERFYKQLAVTRPL
ncbi:hypothetical protein EVAR_62989_1 [Eumeta japonica]|uniref:Uncharacterized protein n=1 Tax=Eumeta variegata TaxID=151549 RepID=A0A4C1ZJZ6_EUMVA|nr:hypothetical protein EVAR_62989_1 [Eumeta japonica]